MRPPRVVLLAGTAAALLTVTPVMLAAALLGGAPPSYPDPPLVVAERVDRALAAGRLDAAFAEVDFRAKGRSLLPELWEAASDADRDAFVALLQNSFRTTTESLPENLRGNGTWWEMAVGPAAAMVEKIAPDSDLAVRYWLERRGDAWAVVDRTFREGRRHVDTSRYARAILKSVQGQLRHAPTLREFVDNAPSWIGRVRARQFTFTGDEND